MEQENLSVRAAAKRAGIPVRSFQAVLDGHQPSIARAAEICDGLGIQFHIGPPQDPAPIPDFIEGVLQVLGRDPAGRSAMRDFLSALDANDKEQMERNALPPDTDNHRWGDRRGKQVTPYPVPIREGHQPAMVGYSLNGCAHYGLDFLLEFDLNPKLCEVIEIFDESMAPEFPTGSAGLVDLRHTERVDGHVCALCVPNLTVRRATDTPRGWVATADNPDFESFRWRDGFEIVGQVVWTSHMTGREPVSA